MATITTPIVGSFHRPPAEAVLTVLPLGSALILEPEPENPWDPSAIKVLVSLSSTYPVAKWAQLDEALQGTNFSSGQELIELEKIDGPLHLGYVPKSGNPKTCKGYPGNQEVAAAITRSDHSGGGFAAHLSVAPEGFPTVTITTEV